jgi:hypothetical protein
MILEHTFRTLIARPLLMDATEIYLLMSYNPFQLYWREATAILALIPSI